MATRTRRAKKVEENLSVKPLEDEGEAERREAYLKRIKKEDAANKDTYKKSGSYICLNGYKVLVKYRNATGSVYTRYWFNAKKHPAKMAEIRKLGGFEIDGEFIKLDR